MAKNEKSDMYEMEALHLYKRIAVMEKKLKFLNDNLGHLVSQINNSEDFAEYVKLTTEFQTELDFAEVYYSPKGVISIQYKRWSTL